MIRRIIKIAHEKCNGCGICVNACHEGAIELQNGKAVLIKDDYCDGLGDCLPTCPTNAISFEEREAAAYDEEAVMKRKNATTNVSIPCGCPGSAPKTISKDSSTCCTLELPSQLSTWPVQIKLVPVHAPYFCNADLLIAADCTAYAYGNFHSHFMQDKVTVIGCPKLDGENYAQKLTEILLQNQINSVTVVRMEVPCCGGIELAAKTAVANCGKELPLHVFTITTDGKIK